MTQKTKPADAELILAIQAEMTDMRAMIDLNTLRINQMEAMLTEHSAHCAKNSEDMREMLEMMKNIKQGMRITNFLRDAFVWCAGLITAALTLWQAIKHN